MTFFRCYNNSDVFAPHKESECLYFDFRSTVCGPWSATFPNMTKYFVQKKKPKKMNVSDGLLISLLSCGEVSAFLLLVKARNSSFLTDR